VLYADMMIQLDKLSFINIVTGSIISHLRSLLTYTLQGELVYQNHMAQDIQLELNTKH